MTYNLKIAIGDEQIYSGIHNFHDLKKEANIFLDELTITDIEEGKKLTFEIEEIK